MDPKKNSSSENTGHDTPQSSRATTISGSSGVSYEGYEKFQSATMKAVKRLTSKTKILPYFKEHFRSHYKDDGKYFLELYKSMMHQLEGMIKDELQIQMEASDVQQLLTERDKAIQDNPVMDLRWMENAQYLEDPQCIMTRRPSGDPKEDIKAHLHKPVAEEVQQLEKILSTLEYSNKLLNDKVAQADQRLERSIKVVESQQHAKGKAASIMTEETFEAVVNCVTSLNTGT